MKSIVILLLTCCGAIQLYSQKVTFDSSVVTGNINDVAGEFAPPNTIFSKPREANKNSDRGKKVAKIVTGKRQADDGVRTLCTNTTSTLEVHTCNSYTLNNIQYDTSGTYQQTIPNHAGCDSLITLHLTVENYLTIVTDTACESYMWQGMTISSSGTYSARYVGIDGCDSLFILHIVIKNKTAATINQAICSGQLYEGYSQTGTYVDTFTGANGCDSVRTLNLTVIQGPVADVSAAICGGTNYLGYTQTGVYSDTFASVTGCDSIRILHLYVSPVLFVNDVSICEGATYFAGGSYQTVSGKYDDTLLSVSGCDSIIRTNLLVLPKPVVDLGQDRGLCIGQPITLTPGNFASYLWQDGTTLNDFVISDIGTYWVSVTDSYNCQAADTLVIKNILPLPAHFLPQKDSICQYEKLTLTTNGHYQDYLWSTGSTQPYIVAGPGKYMLTVKDDNGCEGSDTINILQKNCRTGVYIPTAFTPNNDQLNDVFRAKVYGDIILFNLRVYNRFGELVFATNNAQQGWDGNVKGAAADGGVFVWLCSYQLRGNQPVTEKGAITLIR